MRSSASSARLTIPTYSTTGPVVDLHAVVPALALEVVQAPAPLDHQVGADQLAQPRLVARVPRRLDVAGRAAVAPLVDGLRREGLVVRRRLGRGELDLPDAGRRLRRRRAAWIRPTMKEPTKNSSTSRMMIGSPSPEPPLEPPPPGEATAATATAATEARRAASGLGEDRDERVHDRAVLQPLRPERLARWVAQIRRQLALPPTDRPPRAGLVADALVEARAGEAERLVQPTLASLGSAIPASAQRIP